jgi:hypothetical protein
MVLSLLKMALVICIPFLLVIGTYDLKNVVTVSVVMFALFFVDFWFQLARWVDSTLLDALYGSGYFRSGGEFLPKYTDVNPWFTSIDNLSNGRTDSINRVLEYVMGAMFTVLPSAWVAALSWVGIRAGTIIDGVTNGTSAAAGAGGKGPAVVGEVVTTVATAGAGKAATTGMKAAQIGGKMLKS